MTSDAKPSKSFVIPQIAGSERRNYPSWTDRPHRIVIASVALFVAVEAIGSWASIELQAILDAIFVVASFNLAIFGYRNQRTVGIVMGSLFASRLFALTLPMTGGSVSTKTFLCGVANISIAYLATYALSHDLAESRRNEGLSLRWPFISRNFMTAMVVVAGGPIGWAAYELLSPSEPTYHAVFGTKVIAVTVAAAGLLIGAIGEELIYRRLVAAMVQHTATSQTPWVSATLCGAAYLGTQHWWFILLTFATGALFAWSCERTGNIRGPIAAHAIISILALIVLPSL